MVPVQKLLLAFLALSNAAFCLASLWHFTDGVVSVQGKGAGVGASFKEKSATPAQLVSSTNTLSRLVEHQPLSVPITLGATDLMKIVLTVQEGKTAKRPHQAFLLLKDADTGLDISYPFGVKENGKAKVELVGPIHLLCRRV
jgi:oligosaccharyltransferase complex subunit delta (ribophorin II)